jgi:dUTP pyrophosphatase
MDIEKKIQEFIEKHSSEDMSIDNIDQTELDSLSNVYLTDDDYERIKDEFGFDLREFEKKFVEYAPKQTMNYVKLNEDVVDPSYNYETDSGFDLHSTEDFTIEPLGRYLAPTGLKFDIPENNEIQIRPKSGLALKFGLTVLNTPGTVDEGYNGEIKVILFNSSNVPIKITKGMKIAQAVVCPVISGKWLDLKKVNNIEKKDRNEAGFGSTGI